MSQVKSQTQNPYGRYARSMALGVTLLASITKDFIQRHRTVTQRTDRIKQGRNRIQGKKRTDIIKSE